MQKQRAQSGSSTSLSDLFVQFRWFLFLLAANLALLVAAVVFDSVLGYPVFGGLLAAFASVGGSLVLAVGLVLLAYQTV